MCLKISPRERIPITDILNHSFFANIKTLTVSNKPEGLLGCRMPLLHHWWQLAGGDIYVELKKQGLIKNSPPILSMPM